MACALFMRKDNWPRLLKFLTCFMKSLLNNDVIERANSCDAEIAKDISSCASLKSELGQRLLKEVGRKTKEDFQGDLTWVPWITVGDDYSKSTSRKAELSLENVLCEQHQICLL